MGRVVGIVLAVLLHVAVILFGGWFFMKDDEKKESVQDVDLVSEAAAPQKPKDEKEPEPPKEKSEEMEVETEEAPDAAEIIRSLDVSAAAAAPELEALSLGAIEQALSGGAAGGEFADAVSFASGGKIGGKGRPGSLEEKLEGAFSLAEIDQQPRVIFQVQPPYPPEMRGKKVEGTVTVIFVVDATGKVTSPKVVKSSHPAFERPALDAVRQWKFEPGLRAGQRVGSRMRIPIRFQPS
jgi:protein TonB